MNKKLNTKRILNYIQRKILYLLSFDITEFIYSIKTLYTVSKIKYQPKSVLMIEPNDFHGEILPGFCYYFNELGYHITLLVKKENYKNGIFDLFEEDNRPLMLCANNFFMKLCAKFSQHFDIFFITSDTIVQKYSFFGVFFKYFGYIPHGRKGYLIIAHHFQSIAPDLQSKQIDYKNIFLLSQFMTVPMLNPNYFGSKLRKTKQKFPTFVTVGRIGPETRNFKLLINTVNQLISNGFNDFQIYVIGRGIHKINNLPSQVKLLGELDFTNLYVYLLKSDYFLFLLDSENENHKKYLQGETTGSRQLVLGFNIIPIIQQPFAEKYNFNKQNAIIYEKSMLFGAMRDALDLSKEERFEKEKLLEKLTNNIRQESLQNLRKTLH